MENNGNRMNVLEDLINEFELNQSLTNLPTFTVSGTTLYIKTE